MRTTLSLDPDVAAELERIRRRSRDRSLKALVNELLRLGLRQLAEETAMGPTGSFRTRAVSLGTPSLDLDNVAEALAIAEGEAHR